MMRAQGPVRRVLSVAAGREGDRVTTLELLFDLVYAFAFTQVTGLMSCGSFMILPLALSRALRGGARSRSG